MTVDEYKNRYQKYIDFINKYKTASNASTGSEVDSNANVESKNITTLSGEIYKREAIGTNRLLMMNKLSELYGKEWAERYIDRLESHLLYKHDETNLSVYCVSITLYPFLFNGLVPLGGQSEAPKNLDSFCGSFVNLVFAVAAQFAGAVSTPEFLTYLDYFLRREFGEDYYKHSNEIVIHSIKPKTICDRIDAAFQQVVYSLNQPAAARNFQSVFWNISYFDEPYFHGIFTDFVFPDGTTPCWESVSWLQKYFMKWFNKERTKQVLTFPVETMNLLDDGVNYVDQEWADFAAEMYAEGHSFFTYRSGSVDSLASCCFAPDTQVLVRSSDGERLIPIKELHDTKWADKRNLTVFHNGSWVSAKTIALPAVRPMYRIETANKKVVEATDNHIFPTLRGDVPVSELTTDDYILCNTRPLMAVKERDLHLTYEQGFLIGMYLGDGSIRQNETKNHAIYYSTDFSLNEAKYTNCIGAMRKALSDCDIDRDFTLGTPYNNVYPVRISGEEVVTFIREYVVGKYAAEKGLNPSIFAQSYDFRKGILDGLYATDGGNSNRIYTTSERLVQDLEALCTSLGLSTVIDVSDRTDEKCIIREQEYNHNYPLWCVRWYTPQNRRTLADVYKVINNGIYFKVQNITSVANNYDSVYCFECRNQDEPYFTLPNGMITHNCRLRNELQDNTFSYTLGAGGIATGSKGVMTININRLVQWAVRDGIDISDAVRQIVDECHHYLIAFNEIMKDNFKSKLLPVYDAGYISLEKQFLTIGINGFVEGAEFLGIDITPNEQYFEYGEKILRPIFEANKAARTDELMFNTEFVPAENLGVKNAKWDKADGLFSPRECYNSYFFRPEDDGVNLIDKFILHGNKLTQYLDGGSANHVNLQEHLTKKQYQIIMQDAIKTGCSYFTFNVRNTICNKCGYIDKHTLTKCPKCGSEDIDYATRIIGYLKRVSKFSEARQKEAAKRYYGNA